MAISFDFFANVREFLRGTKNVEEALEDVSDSLDDVVRDSDKAGDKIGDNISAGAKEAEKGVERLERSFKDLADTAKQETKSAGDATGKNWRKGTDEASEGLKDFKQEANSTAKESAASFDGSAESIVDVFQEVAANAFEGFGPAGAAAGIAAAVGIGLVTSAFQQAGEETEAYREQVKGIVDQLFEIEGNTKLLDYVSQLRDFLEKGAAGTGFIDQMADFWEQSGTNFDQAQRDAKNYKVDLVELLKSYSGGDAKTAQATIEKLQKTQEALRNSSDYRMQDAYVEQARAIDGVIDRIKEQNSLTDDAVAQYEAISAATTAMAAEQEAAAAALEATAQHVDALNDAYDEAASSVEDFVNKETGVFDVGAYIAAMQAKEQALKDYQETLATSPLTPEAKAFLDAQGAESAAQFLAGYKAATPEQQAELGRIWTEAGKTSSGSYTEALKAGIPASIDGPVIQPRFAPLDFAELQRQINNNPLVARVQTKFDRVGVPNI